MASRLDEPGHLAAVVSVSSVDVSTAVVPRVCNVCDPCLQLCAVDSRGRIVVALVCAGFLLSQAHSILASHFCRFFQQLVEGVEHCHSQGVVHRDLRLEHLLLDGNFMKPTLKITGFGYSKSNILDSLPKTTVGAPTYTPPGGAST